MHQFGHLVDSEIGWLHEIKIQSAVFIRREIKDKVPLVELSPGHALVVDELANEIGCDCVFLKLRIHQIEWPKRYSVRALNNRIVRRIQVDLRSVKVAAPKLRTADRDLAVITVSNEDRCLDRCNKELGVLASVDLELSCVV